MNYLRKNIELAVAASLTAVAVGFHAVRIFHAGALWRDEVNSVSWAMMPSFTDFISSSRFESIPLFSLALLRVWTSAAWGASDFGLRVFGFLAGSFVIAALWWTVRAMGAKNPTWSLLLMGFNGVVICYGDSTRAYGISMFFIVLAIGSLWQVIGPSGRPRVLRAALVSVLAVQCSYSNAFLLLGICLAALLVCARFREWKRAMHVLMVGVVAACSLLPYVGILQKASEWQVLLRNGLTIRLMFERFGMALSSPAGFMCAVWLALAVLSLAAYFRRPGDRVVLFASCGLLLSCLSFFVWLQLADYPTLSWNYLPLVVVTAVFLDAATSPWFDGRTGKAARIAVVCAITAIIIQPLWREIGVRQTNMDFVARTLKQAAGPDDLVIVANWYLTPSFQRYYDGPAPWISLPPGHGKTQRFDLIKQQMASSGPIADVLSRAAETLRGEKKVWLVGQITFVEKGERAPPLPPEPLAAPWRNNPTVWQMQAGYFLQLHALRGKLVPVPVPGEQRIHSFENVPLAVVEGWRA